MATAASSSDARTRSRRACTRYARVHFNIAQEYSSIKPVSLFLVANLSHALLCHTTVQAVPALAHSGCGWGPTCRRHSVHPVPVWVPWAN